ncbi:MAG: hypothetical protein N2319_06835 [Candidatus Kapabacteria bacterium]|nr:hypothetical protein [Candidatus Kapabacteria bacterium]
MKQFSLILFFCFSIFNILLSNDDNVFINRCGNVFLSDKKERLQRVYLDYDSLGRPKMQKLFTSKSGRFVIHYNISGKDSVYSTDRDKNGIPDFVDSAAYYFDYAYQVEVEEMGYLPHFSDENRGGSNSLDVYLIDLGNGSQNEVAYGFTIEDGEVLPRKKFSRYYTYIVIDNNFSPQDSIILSDGRKTPTYKEKEFQALKITAAHEYHHAVQAAYGVDRTSPAINELTSTYMEFRVHPNTTDYEQFVRSLFRDPSRYVFGIGNQYENGYRWSIFGQYIHSKYGDWAMKRWWENIGEGIQAYQALNQTFSEKGSNLIAEWCEFLPWLYFTGSRAIPGKYFKHADRYPEVNFYYENSFSPPSFNHSNILKPFEFRFFRCTFNHDDLNKETDIIQTADTLDFIVTNTDLEAAVRQITNRTQPYTLLVSDKYASNLTPIENSEYYFNYTIPTNMGCYNYYFNKGYNTTLIATAFPSPFLPKQEQFINIPVPANAFLNEEVELFIFDTDFNQIYYSRKPVVVNSSKRVLQWSELPQDITSGVYLFKTRHKGKENWGKFTLIMSE